MFYSKSQNGFYSPAIHGNNIPSDAVEITAEQHRLLIDGQSKGKVIAVDESGFPVLQDQPVLVAPDVAPKPHQFTSLEYLDLFTEAEQLAVANATMQSAAVKLWYDRMLAASFITLADPRTEAGLSSLVGAGLLTEARKLEIIEAMS